MSEVKILVRQEGGVGGYVVLMATCGGVGRIYLKKLVMEPEKVEVDTRLLENHKLPMSWGETLRLIERN